jgi:transketolase
MKLAEYLADQLCSLAETDEALFVLDGDLADSDGADRFANRFLMAGIAEQNLVSVAAGLASTGRKPWAFSFAAFLACRAYDQIRICLAQSKQPVVLVGSHAGGLSARNGKSHAVLNDIAMMTSLPHIEVYAPADSKDVDWLTRLLVASPRAAYVRLPRADIDSMPKLSGDAGPIRIIAPPATRTLISTGLATHWAAALALKLTALGQPIGLIHLPCLKPFPDLTEALQDVDVIITLEDHVTHGGLGSLVQDCFPSRPVTKLGWPVEFAGASGSDDDILRAFSLNSEALEAMLILAQEKEETAC